MAFPRRKNNRNWRVYIEGADQPLDWAMTEEQADALVAKEKKKGIICRKVRDL